MTVVHPPDAELADFLLGKLPDPDHARVESHLADCEPCQTRTAEVAAHDTLVELLASAGTKVDADRSVAATRSLDITPASFAPTNDWTDPASTGPPAGLIDHPRYRLVRPLGSGGMGTVWLAEHAVMGRPVALKVIRPEFLAKPGAIDRFRREVRAAAQLHHPNIATAFDADEAAGVHFLVMEFVPGATLAERVKAGPLPMAEACRAVRDAARGLAAAHAAGLVHRDVKPGNLIRDADGTVKVLDFGLVVAGADRSTGLTGENVVVGTPDYIAPEQATDARTADARSDVYSLGCTLYHLLAGKPPFAENLVLAKLDAHRDPDRTPDAIPGLPAGLTAVLAKMLAKNPADRYQTASAVADALDSLASVGAYARCGLDGTEPASGPHRADAHAGRTPRRSPRLRWFALAFAPLVAAAGGVVYKIQRDNEVITLTTDDPDIEVVMKRNGELIQVVDPKTKKPWELDVKNMRLRPDGGELTIDLPEKGLLVIRRNGDVAVRVEWKPPAPKAKAPADWPDLPAVEELHRIPFEYAGWLDISGDGKEFLAYTGKDDKREAVFFDTASGKETGRFSVPAGTFVGVWFLPGSRDVLVSVDYKVSRRDRGTGAKLQDLMTLPEGLETGTSVKPLAADGTTLCVAVHGAFGPTRHGTFLYDLGTGNERFRVKQLGEKTILGTSPRLSPDGKLLATTDTTRTASVIRLWDTATGELVHSINVAGFLTAAVEFSRDGREVVAWYFGDGPGYLGVWEVTTGKPLGKAPVQPRELRGSFYMLYGPPWAHSAPGTPADDLSDSCFLLPGGELFVFQSVSAKSVLFCDARTGVAAATYRPGETIRCSVASADGRSMVCATDTGLRIVRTPDTKPK